MFKIEIFTLDYLKGFFKRNKKLLIISLIIIIASLVLFAIGARMLFGAEATTSINKSTTTNFLGFIDLFVHNFRSDAIVLLGGFLLSILSLILTIYNCFIAGAFLGVMPRAFAVGILPHGIFEYAASVFSLVGAFIITKLEIVSFKAWLSKDHTVKEVLNDNKNAIKDIILIIVLIIILLLIAAFIENYITPMLLNMAF